MLRTRLKAYAVLGLFALALQYAVTLVHRHDSTHQGHAHAGHLIAFHMHGADHADHGHADHGHADAGHHDRSPVHDDGIACDICWLRSHGQQMALLALPLPAVQPVTYQRISYSSKPQARPVILWPTPVQARAPPLAATV